ncbi:MAG: hypothetical protein Q9M08_08025 [Mariprofundus sp.]|nr:hypothetical protein [Mariprofundus sp.]
MLTRKLHIRGFSRIVARLMAVMFAVQMMVGGFCLLTAEAHAMPQSIQTQDVHAHCAKSSHADDEHSQDHSGNCYHCDQPDELSNSAFPSVAPLALVLSDIITMPAAPLFTSAATGMLSTRTPTGPPRSSSLLYSTTPRIRV